MYGARILVVDDDPDILRVVGAALESEAFDVSSVSSVEEARMWLVRHGLPHLAIIDIRMPGESGIDLAREILAYSDLPIIFLTAVDDPETVVGAIEELAEDYLVKPCNPAELAARAKRVLRRFGDFSFVGRPVTEIDETLAVDFVHQRATVSGRAVSLTPTESKLLHIFVRSKGRTLRSDYLLRRVWPLEEVYEDTLRVHIHRLRKKIESAPRKPRYIVTERGLGYAFLPAHA